MQKLSRDALREVRGTSKELLTFIDLFKNQLPKHEYDSLELREVGGLFRDRELAERRTREFS